MVVDEGFSPNGKYLTYYTRGKRRYHSKLNVLKIGSNSPSYVFEYRSEIATNRYSPDGKYLAFIAEEDKIFKVYLMELKSGKIVRTTFHQYLPKLEFLNKNILLILSTEPNNIVTNRKIYKIIDLSLGDNSQAFEYYKKNFYTPLTKEEKERYGIIE